jgi:hypothetical protein
MEEANWVALSDNSVCLLPVNTSNTEQSRDKTIIPIVGGHFIHR